MNGNKSSCYICDEPVSTKQGPVVLEEVKLCLGSLIYQTVDGAHMIQEVDPCV